jgi:CBS domain containing-hemolysin-like protein
MGIVVDEHGTVVGVVTLDDLLAELVGELLDETDVAEADVEEVSEGLFLVRGGMDIDDFAEHFRLEVPEGDYTTVGGFISARAGEVLNKGDEVEWEGIRFTVSGVEGHRVTEISLHRIDPLGDPLQTEEAR